MVNIIHCPGHKFSLPTRFGQILRFEWKCDYCGLKVYTLKASQELTGKPS